jgi:hypothetical protein
MYHFKIQKRESTTGRLRGDNVSVVCYAHTEEAAREILLSIPNFGKVRWLVEILPMDGEGEINSRHGDEWDYFHLGGSDKRGTRNSSKRL